MWIQIRDVVGIEYISGTGYRFELYKILKLFVGQLLWCSCHNILSSPVITECSATMYLYVACLFLSFVCYARLLDLLFLLIIHMKSNTFQA